MTRRERIGFIGIGTMGWHMASNLVKAGFDVTVADANAAQCERFMKERGGRKAGSPAELGRHADIVITMLPTGTIVREVLLEEEDGALSKSLGKGSVVIDMSSSEPTGTRRLAADLKEHGVSLVDAPVSGGVVGAEEGKLTIMIGGDDPEAIDRAMPVLAAMGQRRYRMGGAGTGHAIKALNNLLSGAGVILMFEALIVGQKFGLDPATMLDVINESTGRSHATSSIGKQEVISRRFATKFMLGLMAKDVGIAADLAENLKAHAPMVRLVRDLWVRARESVGAQEDLTCAVKYWETLNGIEVGVPDERKPKKGNAKRKASAA